MLYARIARFDVMANVAFFENLVGNQTSTDKKFVRPELKIPGSAERFQGVWSAGVLLLCTRCFVGPGACMHAWRPACNR